ncbi:MAG: glycosyltransferase, partial [Phycisphaeraceae bacterium]
MLTLSIILIAICGIATMVWATVWHTARLNDRALPPVAEGLARQTDRPLPRLSVVLPMHNEAHDAPACIETLRAQDHPDLQIVLSLDRCTDETPAIAKAAAEEDQRVKVVETTPMEGWWGKCVPMHEVAAAADGEWLVFVDADTRLDPKLLRAALGLALDRGWDMVGVLPKLSTDRPFERIVQPAATMQMMYMFQPRRINREHDRRPFCLGPFIMISRDAYDAANLMTAVKDDIQEDLAIARAVHAAGRRVGLAAGDGMFECRMFGGFGEFYHGWKRILTRMSGNRVKRLRKYAARLALLGVAMPTAEVAALILGIVAAAQNRPILAAALMLIAAVAVATQFAAIRRIYRRGGDS